MFSISVVQSLSFIIESDSVFFILVIKSVVLLIGVSAEIFCSSSEPSPALT